MNWHELLGELIKQFNQDESNSWGCLPPTRIPWVPFYRSNESLSKKFCQETLLGLNSTIQFLFINILKWAIFIHAIYIMEGVHFV